MRPLMVGQRARVLEGFATVRHRTGKSSNKNFVHGANVPLQIFLCGQCSSAHVARILQAFVSKVNMIFQLFPASRGFILEITPSHSPGKVKETGRQRKDKGAIYV
jgi:hypothetical protein